MRYMFNLKEASITLAPVDRLYFDYNASAPLSVAAREAMLAAMELSGNPSSVHSEGRQQRRLIEAARAGLAAHAAVEPKQVIFTSGASEAASTVLSPRLRKGTGEVFCSHLYVSAIEHPCVLAGGRFTPANVSRIPVNGDGVVDIDQLAAMLDSHDASQGAPMVAIMLANNETGVIQPVAKAGEIVHAHGGYLVVDAVQGLGRLDVSPASLNADFVIVSSHKAGGPKGTGAILLGNAAVVPISLIAGGGQENYHRAGTENTLAIAGFGAAIANLPNSIDWNAARQVRDLLEAGLRTISLQQGVSAPVIFGNSAQRLSNTVCFAVAGVKAETALISLDLAGIAVSSGSACSSGKVKKSHVLEAMSVKDDLAGCALRISFGTDTGSVEVSRFLAAWNDIVRRMAAKLHAA